MPEDGNGGFSALLATARQRTGQFLRDRSRKRAAKGRKRGVSRALLALLVVLLGLFFWALTSIFNAPAPGAKLSIDELTAMAANHRINTATFLDVDNRIVGTYSAGDGQVGANPLAPAGSPVT